MSTDKNLIGRLAMVDQHISNIEEKDPEMARLLFEMVEIVNAMRELSEEEQ